MDPQIAQTRNSRAFTAKSVLLSLAGLFVIAGITPFMENRTGVLMTGMHLPVAGTFYVLVLALGWNLLFSRVSRALCLNPRELAVITATAFVASYPSSSGLFRYFIRQLILPWFYLSSGGRTEWAQNGLLDYLPSFIFPQPSPVMKDGVLQFDEAVYRGFFSGMAKGSTPIGLSDIPFHGWITPIAWWGPVLFLMVVAIIAMAVVVHRQWAHHEQLSYPIAQVVGTLFRQSFPQSVPDIFRNRLFWFGFAPILLLYALSYLNMWFPENIPSTKTVFPNLTGWQVSVHSIFPDLKKVPFSRFLGQQTISFSIIGLSYFVATEITFTMGASLFLLVGVGLLFFNFTGTPVSYTNLNLSHAGAYIGYAIVLLYTGRSYYIPLIRNAFFAGKTSEVDGTSVLAARVLLIAFAGFVAMLTAMGLDWLVALVFAALIMLLFLVFTRIICETGIPFMHTNWTPAMLMLSAGGPASLGPGAIVWVLYLGSLFTQDPREMLMPFVSTGLKAADDTGLNIRRVFAWLVPATAVAIAVGFTAMAWTLYNYGGMSYDEYSSNSVPTMVFDEASRQVTHLAETEQLDVSKAASGLSKLALLSPSPSGMAFLATGILLVLVVSLLRFRLPKFPIHPVLFLVWGTYAASAAWASFLIGWALKSLTVRFGGGGVYQNLKPLFIGMIAGEIFAAGVNITVKFVYYACTGQSAPASIWIVPG